MSKFHKTISNCFMNLRPRQVENYLKSRMMACSLRSGHQVGLSVSSGMGRCAGVAILHTRPSEDRLHKGHWSHLVVIMIILGGGLSEIKIQ